MSKKRNTASKPRLQFDDLTEINRKLRILEATIKNLEALVERKVRPLRGKIEEHEEVLEVLVQEVLGDE